MCEEPKEERAIEVLEFKNLKEDESIITKGENKVTEVGEIDSDWMWQGLESLSKGLEAKCGGKLLKQRRASFHFLKEPR